MTRLQRIALLSAVLAAALGVAMGVPLVRDWQRERVALEQQSAAKARVARFASGLIPCEADRKRMLALASSDLPDQQALFVVSFPSFSRPRALRITAEQVENWQLEWVDGAAKNSDRLKAARQSSSKLGSELAQRLEALLRADVEHASAPASTSLVMMDGTTYLFHVPGAGCGYTEDSKDGTRAARLIDLADALSQFASGDGHESGKVERALRALEEQ